MDDCVPDRAAKINIHNYVQQTSWVWVSRTVDNYVVRDGGTPCKIGGTCVGMD